MVIFHSFLYVYQRLISLSLAFQVHRIHWFQQRWPLRPGEGVVSKVWVWWPKKVDGFDRRISLPTIQLISKKGTYTSFLDMGLFETRAFTRVILGNTPEIAKFKWVVLNNHEIWGSPWISSQWLGCSGGLYLWPIWMGDLLAAGSGGHFDSGTPRLVEGITRNGWVLHPQIVVVYGTGFYPIVVPKYQMYQHDLIHNRDQVGISYIISCYILGKYITFL